MQDLRKEINDVIDKYELKEKVNKTSKDNMIMDLIPIIMLALMNSPFSNSGLAPIIVPDLSKKEGEK